MEAFVAIVTRLGMIDEQSLPALYVYSTLRKPSLQYRPTASLWYTVGAAESYD